MSDDPKKARKELVPIDMSPLGTAKDLEVEFEDNDPKGLADPDVIDAVRAS